MISQSQIEQEFSKGENRVIIGKLFLSGQQSNRSYRQNTCFTLLTQQTGSRKAKEDILEELLEFARDSREGKPTGIQMHQIESLPGCPPPKNAPISTVERIESSPALSSLAEKIREE